MEFPQSFPQNGSHAVGVGIDVVFLRTNRSIDSENFPRCTRCQPHNVRLPLGVEGALVGRATILNDQQLRTYNDKKPWALATAEEHSADAEASWIYEHSSPTMDSPPGLSPEANQAFWELFLSLPPRRSSLWL